MSLAIIGGTGALDLFEVHERRSLDTVYGAPSSDLARIEIGSTPAWFLARHGQPHRIPPHRVNYRANIQALHELGVTRIVAVTAVGGIAPELVPGSLVVPDQLIDYSWGRVHSFSDDAESPLLHVEFAEPFAESARESLLRAAERARVPVVDRGCYAVTQGPRLETAAEVRKLAADGCTLVGMTAMPEAALARERAIAYATLSVVANPAAGVSAEPISIDEIHAVLDQAMGRVKQLLHALQV
ncbi:MAG: S-methyl-5'-thioinosine phosphorylase [Wenzhouxiangella sp.]|nr:MAG: S-methyl-5'-thioinosine phosphorylase [Wenzhouxiangella sp.]